MIFGIRLFRTRSGLQMAFSGTQKARDLEHEEWEYWSEGADKTKEDHDGSADTQAERSRVD